MPKSKVPHWASDPYWAEALDRYDQLRKRRRRLVLDLERIERELFRRRGAAKLVLALLGAAGVIAQAG